MTNNETTKTYMELEQERIALQTELAKLEQLAKDAKERERSAARETAQTLIETFGFIRAELSFGTKKAATSKGQGVKRPAKYYNAATGKTWSGSGNRPKCMRNENVDVFLITKLPLETQQKILGSGTQLTESASQMVIAPLAHSA